MTYPGPFLRLVASGTLFSTETFSFGLSLIPNFDSTPDAPEQVPAGIVNAFSSYISSGSVASEVRLTMLKLNLIGPNGRYVNQGETVMHEFPGPGVAGGGTVRHAPQIALAISLRTARTRGRAHAGRYYLPGPTQQLGNDGRLSVADAQIHLGNATSLLRAINDALPTYRVGVASDVGAGAFQEVTHVRVGRVLDTIRSRRTSLDEGYVEGEQLEQT